MPANSLDDLYTEKLQDLYSAEQQIIQALPLMIQSARNPELRRGFEMHLQQTQEQARRLEQLCQGLGISPQGKPCEGMAGIIREGQMSMRDVQDPDARDALLIAAAQSVEHYEMAGYGTARTWARQCGRDQDAQVLQRTLDEEEQTDRLLTQVAEGMVNERASQSDREVQRSAQRESGSGASASRSGGMQNDRPSAGR